jgi:hypothetical protein
MFRVLSLLVVCGVMLTAGVQAQSNVTGAWDLSINGPEGAITAVANLKQDGEKVTGTIESPQGTAELNGTMQGKALNISFTIAGPNGSLDIKVNGEVDGASMKGIIDFGMGMADFTAKKK